MIHGLATKEEKLSGRKAATSAFNKGLIPIKPCEKCGESHERELHMHHEDYSQPLQIRWLCVSCHRRYHRAWKVSGHSKGFLDEWVNDPTALSRKDIDAIQTIPVAPLKGQPIKGFLSTSDIISLIRKETAENMGGVSGSQELRFTPVYDNARAFTGYAVEKKHNCLLLRLPLV